jgi:manganese oxidase
MSNLRVGNPAATIGRHNPRWYTHALVAFLATFASFSASAALECARTLTADVVAFDQPIMYNRLGASNINGMTFALRRDVVYVNRSEAADPLNQTPVKLLPSNANVSLVGNVELRPDKRPRPLVLRIAAGDCLQVTVTNLLTQHPNPNQLARTGENDVPPFVCKNGFFDAPGQPKIACIDEQVADRTVGFHVSGMQVVNGIDDDSSFSGKNVTSLVPHGGQKTYKLWGQKEGVFLVQSLGSTIGADANQGNTGNGLFGQVIVEPKGARIWRSILTEEEIRLAADANNDGILQNSERLDGTANSAPAVNYAKAYPSTTPWVDEGKAGLPIINSICETAVPGVCAANEIVHSEIEMMVVGPDPDGSWKSVCSGADTSGCPYPLESKGLRNPTIPNRLEAFRDLAQVWHDEPSTTQAFPGFYNHPVFKYVLAGVKDGFMINYGSGGIGSEIIANRLGVGPMHDCLSCAYEEFFLTSYTVGDPAVLVDTPANFGLEALLPGQAPPAQFTGPKANYALYPSDPMNVHHAYIGDFIKFRNTHIGKEQHVFHLHNHQWLYNPNDDNANYLDAQGVGPGIGYTYEINFGGSGNRNKSAGDAIFHCHFYPHFAQGMWYHLRNYDTFEEGTRLQASGAGYHTDRWALKNGTPALGARALPDGELVVGVPLVAILPLPGKAVPPLPAPVEVVANPTEIQAPHPKAGTPVGSIARVKRELQAAWDGDITDLQNRKLKNPGYPFWIAGIEAGPEFSAEYKNPTPGLTEGEREALLQRLNMSIVGQRPPTPVLDMITSAQATALKTEDSWLFEKLVPAQADGWDGGLPRHALRGYAAGGATAANVVSARDFTKVIGRANPVFYPEGGMDIERASMRFHKLGSHPTKAIKVAPDGTPVAIESASFATNGVGPVVGAPFHEPCRDDTGAQMDGRVGTFFGGKSTTDMSTRGASNFTATNPRIYKGVNIQFDVILNKVGYHYPQQRIITLWEDAVPVISKQQPPEPLVMRLNTFDCAVFSHSNLVPEYYEMDDYQVRTPTDIIGQHIHLPKWDLTTTDGAANGWNYEDGTLSPGVVVERIEAINCFYGHIESCKPGVAPGAGHGDLLHPKAHPYFGQFGRADWMGARTTMQRWFADPVVNTDGVDRGLGIIFTHDHYGPSTHQQIGLYATVLAQPAGSTWVHNETGAQLGAGPNGTGGRMDGGPTSWQAAILPPKTAPLGSTVKSEQIVEFREFYFEFSDFQHAYEKGVYVGAGPDGAPITHYTFPGANFNPLTWIPNETAVIGTTMPESFRKAINPPARAQAPAFPDLAIEKNVCLVSVDQLGNPVTLNRPCPQAIDVSDPGMFAVNYRNEPVALRVFDPDKPLPGKNCTKGSPDRTGCGMQADGLAGDLAYALATRITNKDGSTAPITRVIPELNQLEQQLMPWGNNTLNAPTAKEANDPFTPMIRAYMGDQIRVKIQAGGHEEEHNASISGMKWLQGGSGHGKQPNSGWRASQAAGISEQFTLAIPMVPPGDSPTGAGFLTYRDYLYNVDSSMDGWWSGTWGIIRAYGERQPQLFVLPSNTNVKADRIANKRDFKGVCPVNAPQKAVNVVAILANDLLDNTLGVTIDPGTANQHVGAALKAAGGTLVYNPRTTAIPAVTLPNGETIGGHAGPLHDPTAMLYVRAEDLVPVTPGLGACKTSKGNPLPVTNAECPVKLKTGYKPEPLVLRGNAGDCMNVTLYNRLPPVAPDLPTLATLIGVVKRDPGQVGADAVLFDNNLIRPSTHVGLSPQLAAIDPFVALGVNAGMNITQTVPPATLVNGKPKTNSGTFRWYLGDLAFPQNPDGSITVVATPVEFGGAGLSPADKVKQGQKSLVGGLVTLPQYATVTEDLGQHAQATVQRRTSKGVSVGAPYRDFMLVMTKNNNHRYADGAPVEHMNGEGEGLPEDSQESSNMSLNYGIEPIWFRFGIAPNAPFGGAHCGPGCYGSVPNANEAFSNGLAGGDPVTPVFNVRPGTEARIHSAVPHGTSRGTTLTFHGHVWQRDPYYCPGEARNGLTGACVMGAPGAVQVASRAIGDNPMGFAQGAQESITPYSHFTFLFPMAGGTNAKPGDYLFRDVGSFGSASGLWGLLRVDSAAPQ